MLLPAFEKVNLDNSLLIKCNPTPNDILALPYECLIHLDRSSPYFLLENKANNIVLMDDIAEYFNTFPKREDDNPPSFTTPFDILESYIINNGEVIKLLLGELKSNSWLSERTQLRYQLIRQFLIYSPENDTLRKFIEEGQILPLGIHGEGLLKLLGILKLSEKAFTELKEQLVLIDWFDDFDLNSDTTYGERVIRIKDRYFDPDITYMTQRSSNEGFLFLLFYFCLFISDLTPSFFAIDNVDASLNPKLCARLMIRLNELAKKYDKQAIFTTHNPAVLDGLDLDDDDQRLFTVYRNEDGHTKVKRILKPKPLPGQEPVKLSEAFLRGYLGGLPSNF